MTSLNSGGACALFLMYIVNPSPLCNPKSPFMILDTAITISSILLANDVDPSSLYKLLIKGIESERSILDAAETEKNPVKYAISMRRIFEYQRILAILRTDTLNSITRIRSGEAIN